MTYTPEQKAIRNARLRCARQADPERFAHYDRERRERHREKLDAASKIRKAKWKLANPEKARAAWQREARAPGRRAYAVAYQTRRYREDPAHNLICRLRARTNKALAGKSKSASTKALLGCSIPEFLAHIESLFQPGMTWENRGSWELDHKRPLISFQLPEQIAEACHYTNLQPLWRVDNRRKKDKWL